jgi:hypothetical protein
MEGVMREKCFYSKIVQGEAILDSELFVAESQWMASSWLTNGNQLFILLSIRLPLLFCSAQFNQPRAPFTLKATLGNDMCMPMEYDSTAFYYK